MIRWVGALGRDPRHEFWPESLSFADVTLTGVIGHRQVTRSSAAPAQDDQ
ncbi:conserved hypothetical protein [Mycolicibacter sinensis]|uniref:Uncharacterized protein n=1 Tax=Mycolicibacter sinensis (strain JDM601) TaxID=875328 RepID=F5YTH2_MYCSD|nr:conserved hypothetical protein [Mycolicibacter sinensis]